MDTCIQITDLKKQFGTKWVTNGVNLSIPTQQMTVIVGRSGEGKSVLLKQIIGLLKPDSGSIVINGIEVTKQADCSHTIDQAHLGYVFQFAALLDSLTIFENIGITLLEKGIPSSQVLSVVEEKLAQVNLNKDILYKYPSEISGGMRKRVGLARTLVTKPKIILYDEPTTGLDPITSRVIYELMHAMQTKLQLTSVVISHDIEIFKYADTVALLHEGMIRYIGNAKTVWDTDNPYMYQFIRGLSQGPIQPDASHENISL